MLVLFPVHNVAHLLSANTHCILYYLV